MTRSLLRHPPFAFLLSSRVLANMGFQMVGVAVGWQIYTLTGSALDLGLVGLVQFVPMILLTLVVGQVADRSDRRLVVTVCESVTSRVWRRRCSAPFPPCCWAGSGRSRWPPCGWRSSRSSAACAPSRSKRARCLTIPESNGNVDALDDDTLRGMSP